MDSLSIDNLILNKKPSSLKLTPLSISIKSNTNSIEVPKSSIRNIDLFRGLKAFCLRICYDNSNSEKSSNHNEISSNHSEISSNVDLHNVHESYIIKLRTFVSTNYGMTLPVRDLENVVTTQGNLVFSNDILSLQSTKEVFSIPKSFIKSLIEMDNDIQVDLGDSEIVFNTTSNLTTLLNEKQAEEICVINGINCINPRSKSSLVFFKDYLILRGSSYDHTVLYGDINEMFFLKNDTSFYLMMRLENPIIQGQTRYESVVFLLTDREIEVACNDNLLLKSYYSGRQCDVVLEILESLLKMKSQESETYFKCTSKVFDGFLYLLNGAVLFLPKSIIIPVSEISHVEFSRINLSVAQARTFDIAIHSSKVYNFSGIQKDAFDLIELYFNQNNVKMVSEVIEDSYESGSSEEDESDLSDIIGSDE